MINMGVKIENFESVNYVWDDLGDKNVRNLDNLECMDHNINLDEMMNDVAVNFLDILVIFENLCNNSNIPLYPDYIKFMKISVVYKLYNLKIKKMNGATKILHFYFNF
jgi:hypothetical protein